jgi:hypothetical protein
MPPRSASAAGEGRGGERTPLLDRRMSEDDHSKQTNGHNEL